MRNLEISFAANLRRLRTEKGWSQQQLAEQLCFSDKSISKWERAEGIPNIAVLYRLSELFEVKLDDLFAEARFYYLGIDGGGTKTRFALADEHLTVLRTLQSDCCNPVDIGIEAATKILKEGIHRICQGIPKHRISLFAGIAGGTASDNQAVLGRFFQSFSFLTCKNDNDAQNIIAAGLGDGDGVAMIMGTGIVAFSQSGGERRRFAGWGYLFDDGGSAYNIGRDGLAAHFAACSGTGLPTALTERFRRQNPDAQSFLAELYAGGKKKIASYARDVFDAARERDAVAVQILNRNMEVAAGILEAAAASVAGDRIPIVLSGGLTADPDTLTYLQSFLKHPNRYDLRILDVEPVMGALLLAKKQSETETGPKK